MCETAKERKYETAKVRNKVSTNVRDFETAKLRKTTKVQKYETTKVRNNKNAKVGNCETARQRKYETTKVRNNENAKHSVFFLRIGDYFANKKKIKFEPGQIVHTNQGSRVNGDEGGRQVKKGQSRNFERTTQC